MDRAVATLTDVARLAGVGKATASAVLNSSYANTRVSQATRLRVISAAAQLRYQPNTVARSLSKRSTDILGFYQLNQRIRFGDPFVGDIMSGLQRGCRNNGKDLLMHIGSERDSAAEHYAKLAGGMVDGLILIADADNALASMLADSHLPVVVLTNPIDCLPGVAVEDADGMRQIAEYLAKRGHKRVLYRNEREMPTSGTRRYASFCVEAARLGIAVEDSLSLGLPCSDDTTLVVQSRDEIARFSAVVCWNDYDAHLVILRAESIGLRVPQDLAVTGFDAFQTTARPAYHLTALRAPWEAVAETAIALLLRQIAGEKIPQETLLPVRLVVGDTA